jgi:hypothetical protein
MRRVWQAIGLVLVIVGVFWVGRESSHGLGALWEHWWCPAPLVLVLVGVLSVVATRHPSPAG